MLEVIGGTAACAQVQNAARRKKESVSQYVNICIYLLCVQVYPSSAEIILREISGTCDPEKWNFATAGINFILIEPAAAILM